MEYVSQKPIYILLPGMEIYLTTNFFRMVVDRPPWRHTHPCHEIVCTQLNGITSFTLVPPLTEHVSKSVQKDGVLCSFLFTFTNTDSDDFCQILRSVDKVTEIHDTFNGLARLVAIKEVLNQKDVGFEER